MQKLALNLNINYYKRILNIMNLSSEFDGML